MRRPENGAHAVRVVVLADTHLRSHAPEGRGQPKWLPEAALARLADTDIILHTGDVLDQGVLERLAGIAPLHAVLGNNDRELVGSLPLTRQIEIAGVQIGMIHDGGPTAGRPGRLRRRFPTADVVVFGHSHAPVDHAGLDGQLLFNPGSPTQRRAQPAHTLGELRLAGGRVIDHRIVTLDARP